MKNVKEKIEQIPFYAADGSVVRTIPVKVALVKDDITGEYVYTPESLDRIDRAIADAAGMLLPAEMKALRERLGLSQRAISRLLKLGDVTWTRWETGVSIPDPANRQRIKMLVNGGLTIYDLWMESCQVSVNWLEQNPSLLSGWGGQGNQLSVQIKEEEVENETNSVEIAA